MKPTGPIRYLTSSVWDTVGALGVNAVQQILILLAATLGVALLATAVWAMMPWQIALNAWLLPAWVWRRHSW